MTKDAIYEGEREVKTFVDLFHGSDVLLKKSNTEKKGCYFTTMGSLLLTAFTFEAFLNHLGYKKIKFWDEIERITVLDKYAVLCKELSLTPDFSKRPFQTLKLLFKFRNAIAHGKSIVLKVNKDVSSKDEPWDHAPKTDWEEFCTESNAVRCREDIEKIILELNEKAELGAYPFINGIIAVS
ncbi:MAG: hypothetical protein ACYC2W_04980 [Desulfurivibrionaceae bacterium]